MGLEFTQAVEAAAQRAAVRQAEAWRAAQEAARAAAGLGTPLFDCLLRSQFPDSPDHAEALCAAMGRAVEGDGPAVPIVIAGPGGCGKTVVARVLEALFPPAAVMYVNSTRGPRTGIFVVHEEPDFDLVRALSGGTLPVIAVSNHTPPPRAATDGPIALFSFDRRVAEPNHLLLEDILSTELTAVRTRVLQASCALRDRAEAAFGGDVWAALPAAVIA